MSKTFEKFQLVFKFVLFFTLKLLFSIHEKYTLAKIWGGLQCPHPPPPPSPGFCGPDTTCAKASPRQFYKKFKNTVINNQKLSLDKQSKILESLFLLYFQVTFYQNILKLGFWPLVMTLYKVFLKN